MSDMVKHITGYSNNKMLKVVFFTYNGWAFGTIHHALCKELFKHNIYANVLDWTAKYSDDEYKLLDKTYDVFVTNPEAVLHLYHKGIPLKKIVTIAHEQWDLLLAKRDSGLEFFNEVREFAVISDILVTKSEEFGIARKPKITPLGIHFDMFVSDIHPELKILGYGGHKETLNFFGVDRKRGHLVEKAVNDIEGIQLTVHGYYNHLCMPSYYKNIDGLIMSSLEEAGGLPAMEAAAAGRLVLGTPVGYFKHNASKGAGVELPLDEETFVPKIKQHLMYYRDNPSEYRQKCQSIQQFARENYDWSNVINYWIEVLEK
jgi:glycosyltransferase involved in cell wall biosynthesis